MASSWTVSLARQMTGLNVCAYRRGAKHYGWGRWLVFSSRGLPSCPITDSFPSKIYSTSVVVSALVDLTPRDRSHACGVSKLYTRAFAEISQRKRWLIVQAILPCERSHGNLGITMKNPLNNIGLISVSLSLLTNCVESKNTEGGGSHSPGITLTSTSSSEESVTSASSRGGCNRNRLWRDRVVERFRWRRFPNE